MWSLAVVVVHVDAEDVLEVAAVEDKQRWRSLIRPSRRSTSEFFGVIRPARGDVSRGG
jgi:hypothetical protein